MPIGTGNIKFTDVKSEMEAYGESGVDSLLTAFALAKDEGDYNGFDPAYRTTPMKWLSNFKGYDHSGAPVAGEISGKYCCLVAWDENIYVSVDYGINWIRRAAHLSKEFYNCWVSPTGQYMFAVANDEKIYVSSNYGINWIVSDVTIGNKAWFGLAGNTQSVYASINNGHVYKTTDHGANWNILVNDSKDWYGIAVSYDDNYLTAVQKNGYIYVYTGGAWESRGESREWRDVAMSASGKYQTAVSGDGRVHTSSNYGSTWTEREDYTSDLWSVDMTASGQYQLIVGNDKIYRSLDYGETWAQGDPLSNNDYRTLSVSSTYDDTVAIFAIGGDACMRSTNFGIDLSYILSPPMNGQRDWRGASVNKIYATNPTIGTLSVGTVTGDRIELNWTAATTPVGIVNYDLYWKESGGSYSKIILGDVLTYIKLFLQTSTTYLFYITATDPFGNESGASNVITQETTSSALDVDPEDWNFIATNPPDKIFTIVGNFGNNWSVTGLASWLHVTGGTGSGDGSFTISCDDNPIELTRNDTFQVTSDAPTVDIFISQDQAPPT